MPRRTLLALAVAAIALLCPAAPALGFGAGTTFLTGGLDLPPGAIGGAGASGYSGDAPDAVSVSVDGRYVAFASHADGLDSAAAPDVSGIYRKDLQTDAVVLVSRATGAAGAGASANCSDAVISADGRRVAFKTAAALDPSDADGVDDVYVRDVDAGTTTLASAGTTAPVGDFDFSGNGRYVAFQTTDQLDAGNDRNSGAGDVYVRDLLTSTTTLASSPNGSSAAGGAASYAPAISDDGRWVAFVSDATNLVAGYTQAGAGRQLFARDTTTRATYLVSGYQGSATRGSNGQASEPHIAGTPGAASSVTIAYTSNATDVATAGVDGSTDASVYVRTLTAPTPATLVSENEAGVSADSRAHTPSISDDGNLVAFDSDATNLGPGDDYYGTYLRNVSAGRTVLASTDNRYAVQGAISGDGSLVAWVNGFRRHGRQRSRPLRRLRAHVHGAEHDGHAALRVAAGRHRGVPRIGVLRRRAGAGGAHRQRRRPLRRVPRLQQPAAGRRALRTGLPPRHPHRCAQAVSRANGADGAPAAGYVAEPTISADGSRVAFVSAGTNLEAGTGGLARVYVRDMDAGTTTLVSRAEGADGAAPDDSAVSARISGDGQHVVFASGARNLGPDASGRAHVYLRDLVAGHLQLVDRATGAGGAIANGDSSDPQISGDGRLVLLRSTATNLDPADGDTTGDLYVRDAVAHTTTLVSRGAGLAGAKAVGGARSGAISADGSTVAFEANDETLAPEAGRWGGLTQVVARTLATGANTLVSRAPGGAPANANAGDPSVSADGGVVAFDSTGTNLLPGVGGDVRRAVLARTMASGALSGPPAFGVVDGSPQDGASVPALSDDGQCMAFVARGHNAATGAAGDFATAYMYVVSGECPKPVAMSIAARATAARPVLRTGVALAQALPRRAQADGEGRGCRDRGRAACGGRRAAQGRQAARGGEAEGRAPQGAQTPGTASPPPQGAARHGVPLHVERARERVDRDRAQGDGPARRALLPQAVAQAAPAPQMRALRARRAARTSRHAGRPRQDRVQRPHRPPRAQARPLPRESPRLQQRRDVRVEKSDVQGRAAVAGAHYRAAGDSIATTSSPSIPPKSAGFAV